MQKNDIVRVEIEEINNLGFGVGHLREGSVRGQVIFVQNGVAGDVLDARIIKVAKSYAVARIERLLTPSAYRCERLCPASGCGGCAYQNVQYSYELEMKRRYVQNAFRKAGLPGVHVESVRTVTQLNEYRNKAQFPVRNGKNGLQAGFFASGTHRIVPVDACCLQPSVFGKILQFVCTLCDSFGISAYDETSGRGLLRHICLRYGSVTGEVMVCLVVNGTSLPRERTIAERIAQRFPEVKSVMLNANCEKTNVVLGEKFRLLFGRDWIEDVLCGLQFRISAGSFYQVNHEACELLYDIARQQAAVGAGDTVLDLYCGIGTIGLSMAKHADSVIGIEIVEEAVDCARENARRNGIGNAFFYCGDASDTQKLLEKAERTHGNVSHATVIMDPPRKGSTEELIRYLDERKFHRVVYISCNPDTLARDCALFAQLGYEIGTVIPVDMFPRTGHVESVVCLTRK